MAELTFEHMMSKIIGLKNKHRTEVTQVLPLKIGNRAVNLFVANFNKQGFDTGEGIMMWPEVGRRLHGLSQTIKSHRYKNPSGKSISSQLSGILVRSGRGRRDVQNSLRSPITGGGVIIIPFEVADGYMGYHNEGAGKLPQRKFMGDSPKLRSIVEDEVHNSFNRIMA